MSIKYPMAEALPNGDLIVYLREGEPHAAAPVEGEQPAYLCKALKPLAELTDDDFGDDTNGWVNECEGQCGV